MKKTYAEIAREYPDLVQNGAQKKQVSRKEAKAKARETANGMRRAICDFARDNGFVIHPKGYDYYIKNMFNGCPCDKTRLSCPCPEAVIEVPRDGHCLCRLFWRDLDTFKESHLPEEK